jgi:hypothetical protein
MKKSVTFPGILLVVSLSVILACCTPGACLEETNSFLEATFYSNTTKEILVPDSVTISGSGRSDKLYDRSTGVKVASLPLNATTGKCTFVIRINGTDDTLQFIYSSYPHLISKECGYTFYHTLDTFYYSTNTIDYVYRTSNNITTVNEENIRIYY